MSETTLPYSGFATLRECLDAHAAWLRGEPEGKRANLIHADLSGANLIGANLIGANLIGANLSGANLPPGYKWERYLAEVVPALLTAGGKTLEEVVGASWECHSWTNCPMAVAFGVQSLEDIPLLYRREAEFFVQVFDARLVPNPLAEATR